MKNKLLSLLVIFWFLSIYSCYPDISKHNISNEEVDMIIQEFTSARIHQYLYTTGEPKDNASLMIILIKQHGFNYKKFIKQLNENNPKLYQKLFVKTGDSI